MVIYPVDNEIGEPRVFTLTLEQTAEQLEAVLAKMVSEYLKGHQGLVVGKRLCKLHQAEVLNIIVSHVQMNQALVDRNSLSNSLCSVVSAFVVSEMEAF